jgi:hypothetical protein
VERWRELLLQHWSNVQRVRWVQKRPASFVTWPVAATDEACAFLEMAGYQVSRLLSHLRTDGILHTLRRI